MVASLQHHDKAEVHQRQNEFRTMAKFSKLDDNDQPFDYGDVFFREPCGDSERLVIGPSGNHIALLCEFARQFAGDKFSVLYVLLLSHAGNRPGRYESPVFETYSDLELFLWTFQTFFEQDGRHHVWVASASSSDLLVYDQHNVMFAYGELDKFERELRELGFREQEFSFPVPHVHGYPPANANTEQELLSSLSWKWSPLREGDES